MLYQLSYAPVQLSLTKKPPDPWRVGGFAFEGALFAPPPRLPVLLTRTEIVGSPDRGQHDTGARQKPRHFGAEVLQHGELLEFVGMTLPDQK
ncbi:hypothetical protein AB0C04_03965 [Micromonospora sp. NPDC048909]|uniref:hypothetical protein n=1 Tax=Micromonospora sp. NPDC048909 TaxID=3155643 RepID=UPI0033D8DAF6